MATKAESPRHLIPVLLEGYQKFGEMGWYKADRWFSMHPKFDWHRDRHWKFVWDLAIEEGIIEPVPDPTSSEAYRYGTHRLTEKGQALMADFDQFDADDFKTEEAKRDEASAHVAELEAYVERLERHADTTIKLLGKTEDRVESMEARWRRAEERLAKAEETLKEIKEWVNYDYKADNTTADDVLGQIENEIWRYEKSAKE